MFGSKQAKKPARENDEAEIRQESKGNERSERTRETTTGQNSEKERLGLFD